MAKTLIKNANVWDGENFIFADVLIDKNKITKIEQNITEKVDYLYDATGKIVSPGLIDLHVHIKGVSSDAFGTNPDLVSIPFGVTAVNEAGGVNGNKALLDSFAVKNTIFVGTSIKNNHADFTITKKCLDKFGKKVVGVKVYFDTTITKVSDITPLKEISNYAKENNLKVMVHCSNSPTSMLEIVEALSPGDILTHIYHGSKNSCLEDNFAAFKLAKEKDVVLDTGFAGHVHTDFSNFKKSINCSIFPDTISTDITSVSAYKRGGRYGMTMCMNIAKSVGVSEESIFKAATATPAQILGKENEWGYLKEGRTADLAVFEYTNEGFNLTDKAGNNLKSENGYRCVLTIVEGQILYKY